MVPECREGNDTTDEAGKLVLLSDSQIEELRVDRIRNKLHKRGVNKNKMKKQELHDMLQKYVKYKVLNVTSEEMNRKALSVFLHTENWHSLKPDAS